jgi:hypothetical protein
MTNYKSQNLAKIALWQHFMDNVLCFHPIRFSNVCVSTFGFFVCHINMINHHDHKFWQYLRFRQWPLGVCLWILIDSWTLNNQSPLGLIPNGILNICSQHTTWKITSHKSFIFLIHESTNRSHLHSTRSFLDHSCCTIYRSHSRLSNALGIDWS